jgi:hypothetical protein
VAATDRLYQINTFEGNSLKDLPSSYKEKWGVAMDLGEPARKLIKGKSLDYYLNLLGETREQTSSALRKRDDKWLTTVDKGWPWDPTNNYCKWFHVCEHESNHNGQIKLLKKRVPGANLTASKNIAVGYGPVTGVPVFSVAIADSDVHCLRASH